jgi:hypothetical protein
VVLVASAWQTLRIGDGLDIIARSRQLLGAMRTARGGATSLVSGFTLWLRLFISAS